MHLSRSDPFIVFVTCIIAFVLYLCTNPVAAWNLFVAVILINRIDLLSIHIFQSGLAYWRVGNCGLMTVKDVFIASFALFILIWICQIKILLDERIKMYIRGDDLSHFQLVFEGIGVYDLTFADGVVGHASRLTPNAPAPWPFYLGPFGTGVVGVTSLSQPELRALLSILNTTYGPESSIDPLFIRKLMEAPIPDELKESLRGFLYHHRHYDLSMHSCQEAAWELASVLGDATFFLSSTIKTSIVMVTVLTISALAVAAVVLCARLDPRQVLGVYPISMFMPLC